MISASHVSAPKGATPLRVTVVTMRVALPPGDLVVVAVVLTGRHEQLIGVWQNCDRDNKRHVDDATITFTQATRQMK